MVTAWRGSSSPRQLRNQRVRLAIPVYRVYGLYTANSCKRVDGMDSYLNNNQKNDTWQTSAQRIKRMSRPSFSRSDDRTSRAKPPTWEKESKPERESKTQRGEQRQKQKTRSACHKAILGWIIRTTRDNTCKVPTPNDANEIPKQTH